MGRAMSKENLAAAEKEFTGWRSGLVLGAYKQPKSITANALIAFRKAPEWEGVLAMTNSRWPRWQAPAAVGAGQAQ